jgi:hypothetical protein
MHMAYWTFETGADVNANVWIRRVGDLIKATALKISFTVAIVPFVLLTCLK